jgi:hypothetical protein
MLILAFGHHEDRTPTQGYEPTREAAMAASRRVGGGLAKCTGIQVPGATGLERATFGVTGRTKFNGIKDSCNLFCG